MSAAPRASDRSISLSWGSCLLRLRIDAHNLIDEFKISGFLRKVARRP
jgi:hypothetical protein